MSELIITITNPDHSYNCDVEVPDDVAMETLLPDILDSLQAMDSRNPLPDAYWAAATCERNRINLTKDQTLKDAYVRNGDYLIIHGGF